MTTPSTITSTTRRLSQQQIEVLRSLKPGQRIQLTQMLRVGSRKWESTTEGIFREINYLATGITTNRVPEDDVIAPMLHFAKDNGELSSIAVDENTQVTVLH